MEGLLNIVSAASALPTKQFLQLLHGFEAHQTFNQKSINELDAATALVAQYLNSSDKRLEGLLLLRTFLAQCQLDLIEQKGNVWLSLCVKICGLRKPAAQVNLGYAIIATILAKSVHLPELAKTITSSQLSKIIESVAEQPADCQLAALKCLECCMRHYAGPCGASRAIIDRFLMQFVDSRSRALVLQSGRCAQLLQQVRGGTVQGLSQKMAWSQYQTQLLASLHALLNDIYANTAETYDGHHPDEVAGTLKAPELRLSAEPIERATQLIQRFQNLCDFLRLALCEPFPVSKAIQPGVILSLIARGLAVNCTTLAKNPITDNVAIGALLPSLHVSLFALLDSLILLLRTNLLPFTNDLCQIVVQSLKWTASGKARGFPKPYATVRQAAYRTLSLWCATIKHGSLVETIAEDLIKAILPDVTPFHAEVTLKVLAGSRKYLSKKARQRLNKAQNQASNLVQTHSKAFNPHNTRIVYSDSGNEALCASALACLTAVLRAAGCFLKPTLQKVLQENIVALAFGVVNTQPKPSSLYASVEARGALYVALYALVQCPHHLCPPPLQYAVEIFRSAQNSDGSAGIRHKCNDFLRALEKTLHPQKETLFFPTDVTEINEAFERDAAAAAQKGVDSGSDSDSEDDDIEMTIPRGNVNEPDAPAAATSEPSAQTEPNDAHTVTAALDEAPTVITLSDDEVDAAQPDPSIEPQVATSPVVELPEPNVAEPDQINDSFDAPADSTPVKSSPNGTPAENDALKSPPRKSARLSAKRRLSTSIDSPSSRSESPLPRRRSTRRNSNSLLAEPPKLDNLTVALSRIDETLQSDESASVDSKGPADAAESDKSKEIDDLASAFIEEFVEEFVD